MTSKTAYLTIDDAPSNEFKLKVDYLLSKNISTVFFCRGELIKERPEDVIYAIKKGFVIGNHSYNHPHFSRLSNKECFEQIENTDRIIDDVYKKSGIARPIKLFRFPYGDKGGGDSFKNPWFGGDKNHVSSIQDFLRKLGYRQPKLEGINYDWYKKARLAEDADVLWTYDTYDWRLYRGLDKLEDIMDKMEQNLPDEFKGLNFSGSRDIILMHDHPGSMDYFKIIIDRLLEKKIKFILPKFN